MPVTRQATISYVLMQMSVDMTVPMIECRFQQYIDGAPAATPEFHITGSDLQLLLGAPSFPGKSRGDDITDAVYAYALANGHIQGSIT